LAIDDEVGLCHMLGVMLRADGHEVVPAASGAEGLRLFQERHFDLVFTDLGMPGMSGWEVARAVKHLAPHTPVVLVTGWGMDLAEERLRGSGVDLVVGKPFRANDVRRAVQDALRLREQPAPGR
jgi:CheY-like chemotaxis protein